MRANLGLAPPPTKPHDVSPKLELEEGAGRGERAVGEDMVPPVAQQVIIVLHEALFPNVRGGSNGHLPAAPGPRELVQKAGIEALTLETNRQVHVFEIPGNCVEHEDKRREAQGNLEQPHRDVEPQEARRT